MVIEILDSESDFVAVKDRWNELADEPFLSWEWNYWWWKHLGQDCELRIVTAVNNGMICGIAPFVLERRNRENCLRFLGSGKACTDHVQMIVPPADADAFEAAIADQIRRKGGVFSDVSLLEFEGVAKDSNGSELCKMLGDSFWSYRRQLESTWFVHLPDSWETFVLQRRKSLRRKIRKAEKRYSSGEAVAKSTSSGLDFDFAFDTLVDLHQRRFISKGESGVFSDDCFTRFLRSATRELAERGQRAEVVIVEVQGTPIAAQLYLNSSLGPQMYQSGMCTESMSLEPGHLLYVHTFKRAIEAGYPQFDFLRGDEPYKQNWGGVRSPLYTLRCVSNRLPNTCKHQMIRGLRQLKGWTKEVIG